MKQWKILARHKNWVAGATITESVSTDRASSWRRFTATIRGFRNWRIWQGNAWELHGEALGQLVQSRVYAIRKRIDRGDETVFHEPGAW